MKFFKTGLLFSSLFLLAFINNSGVKNSTGQLSVLSFNIRYNNPADGLNAWKNRKQMVIDFLNETQPEIIGMQEVLYDQLMDIEKALPGYGWTGVGRDDGMKKGEYVPVFYNKENLQLVRNGNFWLSEIPEKTGSKSWGAHLPRIVTWAGFKAKTSGKKIFFFNTHFSHVSDSARNESARLLVEMINKIAGDTAVILTGDFNFTTESEGYRILVSKENKTELFDAMFISENPHFGGESTYNGFGKVSVKRKIDFIFTGRGLKVEKHGIYKISEQNIYISDHWPVYTRVEWKIAL
jgi:endonuclease/exonuclease/phosphatase family metal-dependent hydrolase